MHFRSQKFASMLYIVSLNVSRQQNIPQIKTNGKITCPNFYLFKENNFNNFNTNYFLVPKADAACQPFATRFFNNITLK